MFVLLWIGMEAGLCIYGMRTSHMVPAYRIRVGSKERSGL